MASWSLRLMFNSFPAAASADRFSSLCSAAAVEAVKLAAVALYLSPISFSMASLLCSDSTLSLKKNNIFEKKKHIQIKDLMQFLVKRCLQGLLKIIKMMLILGQVSISKG